MIHLLLAMLGALAWALWFVFQWTIWLPIAVSVCFGLLSLTVIAVRRIRARRAARALEGALAAQGSAQVTASPQEREQINALQQQMSEGLAALKDSNIGGKRRGDTAVYALPWYAIIGPPGAGKTTALRHSGLTFPHSDTALRGVGGTRNCDWWLTNEAILLDTAGRYATETDDQKEWLEFLDLLRKHRVNKPLNGLILAVALPDVVNATTTEIEAMGKKLRARVDEVMTRLGMTLPVYFLVTKCDLVAGFVELFGNLRKSERAQPWGATIPLAADRADPGRIFERELDLMVQQLHARAVKRLANERDRRARESIYQFPIELVSVRDQMRELVSQVFAPNAFQSTPLFRGFYFTSGTQEGAPLSRATNRMRSAMGLQQTRPEERPRLEPKSYFLHDVFTKVVFPDAAIAARSKAEIRRQRFVRLSIAATAIALAVTVAGPSVVSFQNNRALIDETQRIAGAAAEIDWDGPERLSAKLDRLDPVLAQLKKLDTFETQGVPFTYRFLMYSGDKVREPLMRTYLTLMKDGFVGATAHVLEQRLLEVEGERYFSERETLKLYLMLQDTEHRDVEWATGRFAHLWVDALANVSDLSRGKLRRRLLPHVAYYLAHAPSVAIDDGLVSRVRTKLAKVPVKDRYQSLFVTSVAEAVYDPLLDPVRGNLQFPPLSLDELFLDDPAMLKIFRSKQAQRTQRYYEVPGPYTDRGHFVVLANIAEAKTLLEREAWVVPLSEDERVGKIAGHLDRLAEDYEQRYIHHWRTFFADIEIASPSSIADAITLYGALLGTGEPALLRLVRVLEDHTQWTKGIDDLFANEAATRVINRKVNTALSRRLRGLRIGADIRNIRGRVSAIPTAFADAVSFGVPDEGQPISSTSLSAYHAMIAKLRAAMVRAPSAAPNVFARDAKMSRDQLDALMSTRAPSTRELLRPLLEAPFQLP